jgi:hypothetical protein
MRRLRTRCFMWFDFSFDVGIYIIMIFVCWIRASSVKIANNFHHRVAFTEAFVMLLLAAQIAFFVPCVHGVDSGRIITLSKISQVAASQATISFATSTSIPSGGSITLQFPFGRYGNGTMAYLGTMYGAAISPSGNGEKALDAVNLLLDGVTIISIIRDTGTSYTKLVIQNPYTTKNYQGEIDAFNPNNWNTYSGGLADAATAGYRIKNQPFPIVDYLPFIGSTGICGVGSVSATTSSFIRNGTIIITTSTLIQSGPITVTCSGLTIFTMASTFGGLRISTSTDPVVSIAALLESKFVIESSNRIAFKSNVPVTLTFTVTTAIPPGDSITLMYPPNFFASSITPFVAAGASNVPSLNITCGSMNGTAVVLTTSGTTINATVAFTVTISGFAMGAATPGSNAVAVQMASGAIPFSLVPSGPILSSFTPPPITSGLIAHYNADSWTGSVWFDLSGAQNHVTEVGGTSIAVARPVGAPAYVYGASTAWMRFPEGILPSAAYTLFYVARYNGMTRSRMFQGCKLQWYSGFKDFSGVGFTGVVRHDACSYLVSDGSTNWLLGSDRSDSYRSNGKTTPYSGCATTFDRICVNIFSRVPPAEKSDFAIQSVLVYDVKLSDTDVQRVEAWLQAQQPEFTPANLQVCARR